MNKIKKWKKDPTRAYNVPLQYTGKEMATKWFKKKVCPACGGKMIFTPHEEDTGKTTTLGGVASPGGTGGIRELYNLSYYYTCEECGKEYSLEELTEIYDQMKKEKNEKKKMAKQAGGKSA